MVHSTGEGPAFWVNVIKPFVRGVGEFWIPWLLLINPLSFWCSMLQRGRKLQAGGWYSLGYTSSPITIFIQLQIPFIFEKPRNFITLCWPIWYSVVIKRCNRRAPGDHNWVLGHIADCDVFGGINSYKDPGGYGKKTGSTVWKTNSYFWFYVDQELMVSQRQTRPYFILGQP